MSAIASQYSQPSLEVLHSENLRLHGTNWDPPNQPKRCSSDGEICAESFLVAHPPRLPRIQGLDGNMVISLDFNVGDLLVRGHCRSGELGGCSGLWFHLPREAFEGFVLSPGSRIQWWIVLEGIARACYLWQTWL